MDKTKTNPLFAVDPLFSYSCNQTYTETSEAMTTCFLFAYHSERKIKEQTEWSWRISTDLWWEKSSV